MWIIGSVPTADYALKLLTSAVSPSAMNTISRAQFLRGNWRGHKSELRPPWALNEASFIEACDGCGDCIENCPHQILLMSRGFPQVDFSKGECTFCGDCSDACPRGALERPTGQAPADQQFPWNYVASISNVCLAVNGTSCVRCIESCAQEAIIARPRLGGRLAINIDAANCNACGACVAGCPVNAIKIQDLGHFNGPNQNTVRRTQ
jgi:ferredoxin-type protein NapF